MSQETLPHPHMLQWKNISAMLLIAGVLGLFWIAADDRAAGQPAASPAGVASSPSDVDALRAENDRLRNALQYAENLVQSQKGQIAALSNRILESMAVHKEPTPSTNPVTPEAGRAVMAAARVSSQNNLKMIGQALLMYANAHDQKGPETLEQLRVASDIPSAAFQSPLLNCRYQYLGYTNKMQQDQVVAYEDSDDPSRNVLFADGSVDVFPAEQAAKIIAARHR